MAVAFERLGRNLRKLDLVVDDQDFRHHSSLAPIEQKLHLHSRSRAVGLEAAKRAPVLFDDAARKRQPQPSATLFASRERLEQLRPHRPGNTWAAILNGDQDLSIDDL